MKKSRIATLALPLIALVTSQSWAAECLVATFPFPAGSDSRTVSCFQNVNTVRGGAFHTSSGAKAVSGIKLSGSQTSFINGVSSNNVPISRCGVSVNDFADGEKQDTVGCDSAVTWRIRMFDN